MTSIKFEDAITEFLHQIYTASLMDQDIAIRHFQSVIAETERSSLRPVPFARYELNGNVLV
jgi:hypothetical protein